MFGAGTWYEGRCSDPKHWGGEAFAHLLCGAGVDACLFNHGPTVRQHWTAPCCCRSRWLWAVSEGTTRTAMWPQEEQPGEDKSLSCKCRPGLRVPGRELSLLHREGTQPLPPFPTDILHQQPHETRWLHQPQTSHPTSSQQGGQETKERHLLFKAASGSFHSKLPLAEAKRLHLATRKCSSGSRRPRAPFKLGPCL